MKLEKKNVFYYLIVVIIITLTFTLLYSMGMSILEGRDKNFFQSLQVVFQTFTTTGYGEDAPWTTPEMNILMIGMQVTGIALILTAIDVFAVPMLQSALSKTPPTSISDIDEHIIICKYNQLGEEFISEIEQLNIEYIIIEPDRNTATDLHEKGYNIIYGDPESRETLLNSGIKNAKTLIANSDDETNASIILSAKEENKDIEILTLVEHISNTEYHRLAGASEVFSPRQLLGESLAKRALTSVTTEIFDTTELSHNFELAEISIDRESNIVGKKFKRVEIEEKTGVRVIGGWIDRKFKSPIDPKDVLDDKTILLVLGTRKQLNKLKEITQSEIRDVTNREIIIAGKGEAGSTAFEVFRETNASATVVDIKEKEEVDLIGDVTDPEVLKKANIKKASSILFTLGSDTTTIFATLIARDLNPNIQIIARANETENINKLYSAGADYVQAISTVSGRLLASNIMEGEEEISYEKQIRIIRTSAKSLSGQKIKDIDIKNETGCILIGLERGGELNTSPKNSTELKEDDILIIAGKDNAITKFSKKYD